MLATYGYDTNLGQVILLHVHTAQIANYLA